MLVDVHDNGVEVDVAADDAGLIIIVVVEHDVISHRAGWRREAVLRELSQGAHLAHFDHFAHFVHFAHLTHFAHFAHLAHWIVGDWHLNSPKIKTDACNWFQTLQNLIQTCKGQRY